eukprot:10110039-Alexandrium_andersonii.AAC.1
MSVPGTTRAALRRRAGLRPGRRRIRSWWGSRASRPVVERCKPTTASAGTAAAAAKEALRATGVTSLAARSAGTCATR